MGKVESLMIFWCEKNLFEKTVRTRRCSPWLRLECLGLGSELKILEIIIIDGRVGTCSMGNVWKDLEEHPKGWHFFAQKTNFGGFEKVFNVEVAGVLARCEATRGLLVLEHQETLALSYGLLVCGCWKTTHLPKVWVTAVPSFTSKAEEPVSYPFPLGTAEEACDAAMVAAGSWLEKLKRDGRRLKGVVRHAFQNSAEFSNFVDVYLHSLVLQGVADAQERFCVHLRFPVFVSPGFFYVFFKHTLLAEQETR